MLLPLRELFRHASLEWNPTEKSIRLLKWTEALAAVAAANVITAYLTTSKIEPRLERELRSAATPAFGTYVSMLRIAAELRGPLGAADFLPFLVEEYSPSDHSDLSRAMDFLRRTFSLGVSG